MEKKDLLRINPRDYDGKWLSEKEILNWFELCEAVWLHDGDPAKPHAQLTSGMCSNGFFDCQRVFQYPNLCEILAKQLAEKIKLKGIRKVDWVLGSAYLAICFSYEVAKSLGARHGFVEKDPSDLQGKKMIWQRQKIPAGSKILQVEELIATGETIFRVREAVEMGNQEPLEFLPVVATLIHRPPIASFAYIRKVKTGLTSVRLTPITVISLIEKEIWVADPKDCLLCKEGSKRLRPKTHWRELTGKR